MATVFFTFDFLTVYLQLRKGKKLKVEGLIKYAVYRAESIHLLRGTDWAKVRSPTRPVM